MQPLKNISMGFLLSLLMGQRLLEKLLQPAVMQNKFFGLI